MAEQHQRGPEGAVRKIDDIVGEADRSKSPRTKMEPARVQTLRALRIGNAFRFEQYDHTAAGGIVDITAGKFVARTLLAVATEIPHPQVLDDRRSESQIGLFDR